MTACSKITVTVLFRGLLLGLTACGTSASAQFTANSLAELRNLGLSVNNSTVTLSPTGGDPHPVTGVVTPGHYWLDGYHIANPTNSHPRFMVLGGSDNTYDLSGATINLDTRKLDGFGRNLGHDSGVDVFRIEGSGNTVQGLTLIGQDIALDTDPNAQRFADWSTVYVEMSGDGNTVDGAHVVARGSRTDAYGLSDAFGKGASQGMSPYILHRKASNFRVGEATDAVVNDIHLETYSFGHNFFVQGSTNTTITNSTIKSELFSSQLVVDHSLYQQYGHTWWGEPIPDDIMLSGAEGGVRVYGGSSGLTVDNVIVDGARTGFATVHDGGQVSINNSFAYNTTSGFDVGDNTTITNSGGNIVNGPLLVFYGSGNNVDIDLELTEGTPIGTNWTAAYFNGNADISITSDLEVGDLPEESYIRLGQSYFENWRDHDYNTATPEDGNPTAYNDQTFANDTNQILVFGENATGNVGYSKGGVISNGKENHYDGVTYVKPGSRLELAHVKGLGNSAAETGAAFSGGDIIYTGTPTAATFDDNATVVESGGTLELQPGIQIPHEKLTISGDGVDGQGALYSDGQTGSGTRFGSSNARDTSAIFLDGDATIGVGIAGNQMLVGRIQGTGNLWKRGPGTLAMEKSSTYDGNLYIIEGHVAARSGVVHTELAVAAGASISAIGNNTFNTTDDVLLFGTLDLNSRTDENPLAGKIGRLSGPGVVEVSNTMATGPNTLTIAGQSGEAEFSGAIRDQISLVKSGASTQILSGNLTYSGTTTVSEGTLLVNGSHTVGDAYTVESGGTLGGIGQISSPIFVQAGGTLAPGASAGFLLTETVELQTGSTLEIELGGVLSGDDYDVLAASSTTLGGNLSISLLDTGGEVFTPYVSDEFTVLVGGLSGMFDNVASGGRLDTLGGEGSFLVTYDSTQNSVLLSDFVAAGLAGDFDDDGKVDEMDYTLWRDALGQNDLTPYGGADATGDGLVDVDDYLVWRNNFGATQSATVTAANVPEPATLLLLVGMLVKTISARFVSPRQD